MSDRGGPSRRTLAAMLLGGLLGAGVPCGAAAKPHLGPAVDLPATGGEQPMRLADADCSAAAAEAAAETGGQVLSVSSREEGGQTMCIVTVLVPGEDGGRPRKQTIAVPQ